jgi:hypothetical protein
MTTLTFDTRKAIKYLIKNKAIKYLIKKGVKQEQAEAIIQTLQDSREMDFNTLVTKEYLDAKLEAQDMKQAAALNKTKYEVVWLIACSIAIIGVLKYL